MNRHFICHYLWKQSCDTLDSYFRWPSWPPSWKICNCCYWFLHIWTLRPLFHMNRHFICLYIWEQSWDTLDSYFSAAILAAILEIMQLLLLIFTYLNSTSFFHMNRHFICLYIWKQSWVRFDSEFRRPCWPPSWKQNSYIVKFLTIYVIYL